MRLPLLAILGLPILPKFLFPNDLFFTSPTAHVGSGSGAFNAVLYVALLGVTSNCIVALPSLYVLVGVPSDLYPSVIFSFPVAISTCFNARSKISRDARGW